jgi:hypothetical protein
MLSSRAIEAIVNKSKMSKVPEIPSKTCDASRRKAVIINNSLYTKKVFGFSCHIALKNSSPDKNHSPSGRLFRTKPVKKDGLENVIELLFSGRNENQLKIKMLLFLKK